jgi:hypothetical protein
MKFDVLHNFISPVTGRILADYRYVLIGNRQGIAIPSPALIDLRLDLINLRKRYNTLTEADFIIGHPNQEIPGAQVLNSLSDGFLYNTNGVISTFPNFFQLPLCYAASTADLGISVTYNNGPNNDGIGATLKSILPIPFQIDGVTPPLNSAILIKDQSTSYQNGIYVLTDTGIIPPWILTRSSVYDEPSEINPGDIIVVEMGTVNAETLWVETQVVTAIGTDPILFISFSILSVLPENNIWIGNNLNKPVPQQRVGLINLPSFRTINPTSNFGLYNLYTGQLSSITSPLSAAQPTTTLRIDMSNTPNLGVGKMWIGVQNYTPPLITFDAIPPFVHITGSLNWDAQGLLDKSHGVANEVGLAPGYIFVGSSDPLTINQIIGSNALIIVQQNITTIEEEIAALEEEIAALEAEIVALEAEIVALQAEVVEIQGQIIALGAAVAVLQGQILVIQGQIAALNTRIDNLRLNNISADADVSLYNFKIINLADAVNPQDAVNLRSLATKAVISVTGTANQITANTSNGAVTLSMPSDVVITNSVTAGNLELITNTLQSIDTNGNITITPNGTGNILMIPSASGFVGIGTPTPAYLLDVGGTGRLKKLLGNAELPSVSLGSSTVVGTGASSSIVGSELGGNFTLTTGTGVSLVAGTAATFTLTIAMPSSTFSVVFFPATSLMPAIYATSTSSTVFTLNVAAAGVLLPITAYTWNYQIIGY